jgi:hypothetical protein
MAAHKFLFCLGYLVWHTPTPLVTLHIKTNPLPPSTTVTPYLNVSLFLITGKSKNNEVICIKKNLISCRLFFQWFSPWKIGENLGNPENLEKFV